MPKHLVPGGNQFLDERGADESRRAGYEKTHEEMLQSGMETIL